MLNHQTMEKLHALRLIGMADAYRQQMEDAEMASLSFEERFGLLVDQHWTWRENQAMVRRLKNVQAGCRAMRRGHRFPAPAWVGPAIDANLDHLAMGSATFIGPVHGADRDR
jgi:IstB-like ATP binding protein